MSAIDNAHLLEIIAITHKTGPSKSKPGTDYSLYLAQCVLRGPDNDVKIGELLLNKELALTTTPGTYLAEFVLGVDMERRIVPRITKLHAHGSASLVAPVAKSVAPALPVSVSKVA